MFPRAFCVVGLGAFFIGCAGMKAVHPDRERDKGTLQMDWQSGKLVGTYRCTMVASNGKRVHAIGKSEEEARSELIKKCQDQTVLSFCEQAKVSCGRN